MSSAFRLLAAASLFLSVSPASAMTLEERQALDLSRYTVTDPAAGYFDVAARKAFLAATRDPILRKEIERIRPSVPCAEAMALEPFSGAGQMTMFYEDNDSWKEEVSGFHQFEDAISALAAAELVSADDTNGKCVIEALDRWATSGAFLAFDIKTSGLQTWFQMESTLFAIAFAYSVVRDDVAGMEAEKQSIERWLDAAARTHLAYRGGPGTCCNNHFYRRAVYAAMIGSLTRDDELFRFGVSAVYSAVDDANPDGALPHEMERGDRAAHYQNYATMYLVYIAQIARRQGYDLYAVTRDGKTLDTIVSYTLSANERPGSVAVHSGTAEQKTAYLKSEQYFTWLELAAQRPQHRDRAMKKLAAMRPAYNRSLGGFATLYFMQPAANGRGDE